MKVLYNPRGPPARLAVIHGNAQAGGGKNKLTTYLIKEKILVLSRNMRSAAATLLRIYRLNVADLRALIFGKDQLMAPHFLIGDR